MKDIELRLCIPVIIGHKINNDVLENVFMDNITGHGTCLVIYSTLSQGLTIRLFYIK